MKVVTLHKNWDLYKRGYRAAFRFQSYFLPPQYNAIIAWLEVNRGKKAHWSWEDEQPEFQWTVANGRPKSWRESKPVFIAVKEPTDVSVILLASGVNFG